MKIFPAIDIMGGRAVRLTRGEYDSAKVYSADPAAVARGFAEKGAGYLHMVDLDGAKSGRRENGEVIRSAASASGAFVQVGGGIRTMADAEYYLGSGASRVIIGTAAVRDPGFLREALAAFGSRIAVGVDIKDGLAAVDGWTRAGEPAEALLMRLAELGTAAAIVTDIGRDGMLGGANRELYAKLTGLAGNMEIIASGGVSSLNEIGELAAAGCGGAIVGKALYEGKLDLEECLAAAREAE